MRLTPYTVYSRVPKRMPYTLGFDRYALYFDGVDDYVEVPVSSVINDTFVGRYWTVEVMLKWLGHRAEGAAMIWSTGDTRYWFEPGYDFELRGVVAYADGTYASSGPTGLYPTKDKWMYIAFVRDNLERRVYLNFKKWTQPLEDKDGLTPDHLYIAHEGPTEWLYGLYAFIRVYNRALSEKEIRYNMLNYHNPVRDGLILWLDFEEGHGDKVYDKSGYGNHGTIYGGAKWVRVRQYELRAEVGL